MSLSSVITIDGPSASGKGTLCRLLAEKLNWHALDSGSLYRALALAAKQQHIDYKEENVLSALALRLDIRFIIDATEFKTFLQGKDVSETIREQWCGSLASQISALPKVREALLAKQRAFRQPPGLVTDGRDMGTIVFPDAQLKLFLNADLQERAKRRHKQLKKKGINGNLAQILHELNERDARDSGRSQAPLMPADDSVIIDATSLSINEVLAKIVSLVKNKMPQVIMAD